MRLLPIAPLLLLLAAAPQDEDPAAAERFYRSMQQRLLGSDSLTLRFSRQQHGSRDPKVLKSEGRLSIRRTPGPCPDPAPKKPAYEFHYRATGGRKETASATMPWLEPERYEALLRGFSIAGIGGQEGEKKGLRPSDKPAPAAILAGFKEWEPVQIGSVDARCVEFSVTMTAFEPRGGHSAGEPEAPWKGKARFHIDPVRLVPLRWSAELRKGDEICNFCEDYEEIEVTGGAVETGEKK